jgi:hypothetical protein
MNSTMSSWKTNVRVRRGRYALTIESAMSPVKYETTRTAQMDKALPVFRAVGVGCFALKVLFSNDL